MPIGELRMDPANARQHSDGNIASIMHSLATFGQQKPIVANTDGTIIAGNGTYQAAVKMGAKRIAVIKFDGDPNDASAFGIADNRTAELARWDQDRLTQLLTELANEEYDILATGFDQKEIDKLLGTIETAKPELTDLEYKVVVICESEEHQRHVLATLQQEGYKCHALMS